MTMQYDIIIVGGGLVGGGLATALAATTKLRIALIDARTPSNNDPRLIALNHSSCQFLQHIGIWPSLSLHATPIHAVHVSHQGHFGNVHLHREDISLTSLGSVIPAHYIESALNETLAASIIDVFRPATLQQLTQQDGIATLTLQTKEGETPLQSHIVIGADGTHSTVRTQTNIRTNTFDYGQSALVTRTQLKRSHHHIAYERFTKNGTIAMLPLKGNECATIWSATHASITELMSLSDAEFLKILQREFGYRLGRLQGICQRYVFPLQRLQAEKANDDCVFLLGNALHTLHPIAAQGFNLALYEVALLIEHITKKQTITANDLKHWAQQIQKQQRVSTNVSHYLSQLFTEHSPFISILLQCGIIGLDRMTPLKRTFIEKIMGRRTHTPRLLLSANE